jgi:hypothetical protein
MFLLKTLNSAERERKAIMEDEGERFGKMESYKVRGKVLPVF